MSDFAKPSFFEILKTALVLTVPIIVVNVGLFFLGRAIGAFSSATGASDDLPITVGVVIIASIIGSIIALATYLLVQTLTPRPERWVSRIGYFLLFFSFLTILIIENATLLTFLTLGAMHIVVALPFIQVFNRLSRQTMLVASNL